MQLGPFPASPGLHPPQWPGNSAPWYGARILHTRPLGMGTKEENRHPASDRVPSSDSGCRFCCSAPDSVAVRSRSRESRSLLPSSSSNLPHPGPRSLKAEGSKMETSLASVRLPSLRIAVGQMMDLSPRCSHFCRSIYINQLLAPPARPI